MEENLVDRLKKLDFGIFASQFGVTSVICLVLSVKVLLLPHLYRRQWPDWPHLCHQSSVITHGRRRLAVVHKNMGVAAQARKVRD